MSSHDPEKEDNLLIDWMLALECMQDPIHSKVRGICPLMCGERKEDGSVENLFAERIIDMLPDVIPRACIEVVRRLLQECGIRCSLENRIVREIVTQICKYLGLKGWEYADRFTTTSSEEIMDDLEIWNTV